MKKLTIFIMLFIAVFFGACSKADVGETKQFTRYGLIYEVTNVKSVETWNYEYPIGDEKDICYDITVAKGAKLRIIKPDEISYDDGVLHGQWGLLYSKTNLDKNKPITSSTGTVKITKKLDGIYHRESSLYIARFIID